MDAYWEVIGNLRIACHRYPSFSCKQWDISLFHWNSVPKLLWAPKIYLMFAAVAEYTNNLYSLYDACGA